MFAVLGERGRADHPQFAPGEHRFEHVPGVECTFGGAGADDRVQFVDEEQDPSLRGGHLGQHRFEPLLELAAVLRPGDQRTHVERKDNLVAQAFRHVLVDDALREAFDDGGLADPRIADEHRVVLGLAGHDLHHAADLVVPADDRIQPAGTGVGDQVPAVLLQGLVGGLRIGGGDPLRAADPGECAEQPLPADAEVAQKLAGGRSNVLVDEREQQMLHRHVLVLEAAGLAFGGVEQPGQPLGDHDLAGLGAGAGDGGPAAQVGVHPLANLVDVGVHGQQQPWHDAVRLVEQGEQQVFAVDLRVAEP